MDSHNQDEIMTAKVISVEPKQALMSLAEEVTALMRVGEYSFDRINSLQDELKEGDEVDVKVVGFDRKTQQILVSHKVLERGAESGGPQDAPTNTTLGDLLREQMEQTDDD